jgi:hypothetical protein
MISHWIRPDGTVDTRTSPGEPNWQEMQAFCGGDLELVTVLFQGVGCHMLVHGEGMLIGLPKNPKATEIYYAASRARGVDPADKAQREADAKEQLERLARDLGIEPENITQIEMGGDMENCIYGPAVVCEGQLQ